VANAATVHQWIQITENYILPYAFGSCVRLKNHQDLSPTASQTNTVHNIDIISVTECYNYVYIKQYSYYLLLRKYANS